MPKKIAIEGPPGSLARAHALVREVGGLFVEAAVRWSDDKCHRFGASLAYYALFSLFPLLMLAVTGLGFFLGDDEATRTKVVDSFTGATGAPGVRGLIDATLANLQSHRAARGVSAIVGLVAFVISASAVFSELDTSLNKIWRCADRPSLPFFRSILEAIREKAIAMLLVLGTALFVLVSLVASTVIYTLTSSAREVLPYGWAWSALEHIVSIGFLTITFAAVFRVIPDCRAKWRDVLGGGLLTAMLFSMAKRLLAFYLSTLTSFDAYGAVGAVLALLSWIYLVSLIVFYGAEFGRVYTERYGSFAPDASTSEDERDHVSDAHEQPRNRPPLHSLP